MKTVVTHILTYALWIQSLMIPFSVAQAFDPYANLSFDDGRVEGQGGSIEVDLDAPIDLDGDGTDDRYEGMTEEEIALLLASEQLAQNRADCDDGKGGIEVGVITVKKMVEGDDGSQTQREEKVDCNQIAFLQYQLLEADLGSDKAFQCVTQNWYVDEQVKFAKELELPLAEKFCKDKLEASKQQSPAQKAGECAGGLVCNMLKSPLGDAVGFDPLPAIVEFAAGDSAFGKGCKDTPGTGCLSNVIWGLFKNLFTNIEGFWDLGKMLANGVIAGGKWVVEKVGEAAEWVGDKISDGWAAVSNWWSGTEPVEDATSAKQDVISQQEDGFFKDFLSNPVKTTGNLVSSFMTGIFDMIKEGTQDNFMCGGDYYKYEGNFTDADYGSRKTKQNIAQRGWEEITNFGGDNEPERHDKIRCDQPFIAECASCAQWMNMACGLTGFLGGEVLTAVLTGGAVNLVGKAAKGTATAAKGISAALKQTSAWQKVATRADDVGKGMLKGLDALKGAYKGGTKFLAGIPGAKLATGIVKQGGKLAILLGKKTLDVGRWGKDKLLAALGKGKALAKATRADKVAGAVLKWPKKYLQTLDDAFILGMQGKGGLKIARMARESSRIRNELKGLQAAASGGDETARALVAAHQRRLNLLDEHQRLTREAMKATDDATRTRLLDDAKRQADQLDDSRAAIAKAKVDHDNAIRLRARDEAEQARLARNSDEANNGAVVNNTTNGSTADNAVNPQHSTANNSDVSPGRSYGDVRESAANSGITNNLRGTVSSRKPATLSDDIVRLNPRISERVDDLATLRSPGGAQMSDAQQSFARGILNNIDDAAQREALIKKIADDGWDSLRRSCK